MIDPDGPDTSDLDAIEELKRSRGYELVRDRILSELERKRADLEMDGDIESACVFRGCIRALRMVLRLPEILAEEIGQTIKEQ